MTASLCQCGCGEPAPIAQYTSTARGWVKGQPIRFIRFHHLRTPIRYEVDTNGCWIWQGGVINSGYGTYGRRLAHRMFYQQAHGPIPPGLTIDHLCRVKLCVNPDHLEAVTNAENTRRGSKTRLSLEDVRKIREQVASGHPRAAVARRFGIGGSYVTAIASGQRWGDAPGPLTAPVSDHPGGHSLRSAA